MMFGVQAANKGIGVVAAKFAEQVARRLPKQALTKGVACPMVKTVANQLGVHMTKSIFAKGGGQGDPRRGRARLGPLDAGIFPARGEATQEAPCSSAEQQGRSLLPWSHGGGSNWCKRVRAGRPPGRRPPSV